MKLQKQVNSISFLKKMVKDDLIQTYELKSRVKPADDYLGFNSSDAILFNHSRSFC